jgi:hypothetical protein
LVTLQPSLARALDLIGIGAWTEQETRAFYQNAFDEAATAVDEEALDLLARYAGGLPMLAHEIGDAAFKVDQDSRLDADDALRGIANAAEIVGRKHLEPSVFRAIRSPNYRTILNRVGTAGFEFHFRRKEVRAHLSRSEATVFDNFLRRMTQLGVIVREPEEGPGAYRFASLLHHLYFFMQAERARYSSDL